MRRICRYVCIILAIPHVILVNDNQNKHARPLFTSLIEDHLHKHRNAACFNNKTAWKRYKHAWRQSVHEGGSLLYDILSGSPPSYNHVNMDTYLPDIRKIITFLYAMGIHKTYTQDGFEAGAFLIKDDNKNVFHFLRTCHKAYPAKAATNTDKAPLNTHSYAIDVTSEHFPYDFIADKSCVYFARDDQHNATFIRPEKWSRHNWTDMAHHVVGGIASWLRKHSPDSINTHDKHTTNDAIECNKPHVPHDVYTLYRNTIYQFINNNESRSAYEQDATRISSIVNSLYDLKDTLSDVQKTPIKRHLNTIYRQFDYPDKRYGREIIFGDELRLLAYYHKITPIIDQHSEEAASTTQHINLIQAYAQLSHAIFLHNHPEANRCYAHNNETQEITTSHVDQAITNMITTYTDSPALSDAKITAYLNAIMEHCKHVQQTPRTQDKCDIIQYKRILDDPAFA